MPNYYRSDDKHLLIVLSEEEYDSIPNRLEKPKDTEVSGPILPNGEINWECSCLGTLPVGPCGVQFRDAFSCLRNSKTSPHGEDCVEKIFILKDCMSQYPTLYKNQFTNDDHDENDDDNTHLPSNKDHNKTDHDNDESSSSISEQK